MGARGGTGGFNLQAGATSETALLKGYDFAVLQMIADDLSYRLEELAEIDANSVRPDLQRSAPEIQVIPRPLALFDHDLRVNTVLSAIANANPEGFAAQTDFLKADGSEVPIEVRPTADPEAEGPGRDGVGAIPVLTSTGEYVPLAELAKVRTDEGRNSILRTDQARRVMVSYQFADEILDSQPLLNAARAQVRTMVQDLVLPDGYTIEIAEVETDAIYYWMMGIAAVLTYMVLASLFESFASPLLIFCTLPTAAIGSCWALMLTVTGLSWKLPLLALLGFLHAYFEAALWLYLLSLATWGLVAHVLRQGALLGLGQGADVLARWAVPLLVVGYVHWRLALPSLTVASLAVWLGYRGGRLLADRVRRGQVDPAALTGRLAWLMRRAYRGVAALP